MIALFMSRYLERINISLYLQSRGINVKDFNDFAGIPGDTYLPGVPKIWNEKHPKCPIKGSDKVKDSLDKMIEYYLGEK